MADIDKLLSENSLLYQPESQLLRMVAFVSNSPFKLTGQFQLITVGYLFMQYSNPARCQVVHSAVERRTRAVFPGLLNDGRFSQVVNLFQYV